MYWAAFITILEQRRPEGRAPLLPYKLIYRLLGEATGQFVNSLKPTGIAGNNSKLMFIMCHHLHQLCVAQCNQPSVFTGSTFADSISHALKEFKENLHLQGTCANSFLVIPPSTELYSCNVGDIDIALSIKVNLETIQSLAVCLG